MSTAASWCQTSTRHSCLRSMASWSAGPSSTRSDLKNRSLPVRFGGVQDRSRAPATDGDEKTTRWQSRNQTGTDRHKLRAIVAAARGLRYRGASHPACIRSRIDETEASTKARKRMYHVYSDVLELNLHTSPRCSAGQRGVSFARTIPNPGKTTLPLTAPA
jgi:hypothetical protein